MKKSNRSPQIIFWLMTILYIGFTISLHFAEYWPYRIWWVANMIIIGPVWIFFISSLMMIIWALQQRSIIGLYVHALFVIFLVIVIMGFRFPIKKSLALTGPTTKLRVLTVNVGEKMNGKMLWRYIKKMDPDVMMMQEFRGKVGQIVKAYLLDSGWEFIVNRGMVIASKFPISTTDFHDFYLLGASIDGPDGPLMLYSVHLESPREGLEALIDRGVGGRWHMQGITDKQDYESRTAAKFIPPSQNIIIAGDFNLPVTNPIYKKYWKKYQNSFSVAGKGFGYSRYSRLHGVRIDHILTDKGWNVLECDVGTDFEGDHRAVLCVLEKHASTGVPAKQVNNQRKKVSLPPADKMFLYEDFEGQTFAFKPQTSMGISITSKLNRGKTLQLEAGRLDTSGVRVDFPTQAINKYPKVRFSYQLLPQQPMIVRVKTQFNDWICIGGTPGAVCNHPSSKMYFTLNNDGQWHDLDINIIESVQSLLKGNKTIKECEFYIPPNSAKFNKFWLDDVLIYRD